jgi:hypothetical protein
MRRQLHNRLIAERGGVMRRIRLLPGDRAATNDVPQISQDRFRLDRNIFNVDTIQIDAARWLEGAFLSTATSSASAVALALSSSTIMATIAVGFIDDADITITASDGRRRVITLECREANKPNRRVDYGYSRAIFRTIDWRFFCALSGLLCVCLCCGTLFPQMSWQQGEQSCLLCGLQIG